MIKHTLRKTTHVYLCEMEWIRKNLAIFTALSLTLGLAPFNPPHVWGKLQWLLGGAAFDPVKGMAPADWFDLLMHGLPFVLLALSLVLNGLRAVKKRN